MYITKDNSNIEQVATTGKIIPIDGKIYWHIENFTNDMAKYKVILTFEHLFKKLQPYFTPIFMSTSDPNQSQITLRFRNNNTANDLPIPFGENTLAYAWLADNSKSLDLVSDIWFNDAFNWSEMHKPRFFSLLKVSVHEALHSLGLRHSTNPIDILYNTYQPNDEINITKDTEESIYSRYGRPSVSTPSIPTTPQISYKQVYKELFGETKYIKRLNESQVLIMANNLGIKAVKDDLKKDTVQKVSNKIFK